MSYDPELEVTRAWDEDQALLQATEDALDRERSDTERLRETMRQCAEKLETRGNEEPRAVAHVLRAEAAR